jgi:hypothetical protein
VRFVRYAVGAAVLAAALTACGANTNANNSAPTGGTVASSAPVKEDNTTLEAPQPPATKWHAAGDLCKLIPGAMAAEVLGQPVTQFTEGKPSWLSDPRVIDECNYVYKDEGGTPRNYTDDTVYVANVLVFRGGNEVAKAAEQIASARKYELTEYHVSGLDRAFYVHYEANALGGDMLVAVNNGATGKFDPAALVKFATLVHVTVSNR